jgi:uncharacterized membrane protein
VPGWRPRGGPECRRPNATWCRAPRFGLDCRPAQEPAPPSHPGGFALTLYLALKLLHIASAVAFLGNIVTGLFWHALAARTGDARLLLHTMEGIIRSDRWFTLPGAVAITVTGIPLAILAGFPILRTSWIAGGILLFSISGILFGVRVAPLQRQLRDLARAGVGASEFDFARYHALARRWEWWGAAALATPLGTLVLMVFKP